MEIFTDGMSRKQAHFLLDSIVCPRPIFLVSSQNEHGIANLAPFSMSTIASTRPPMICFSPVIRPDGREKDTLANIRETGDFVVNTVTENILSDVLIAARNFPAGINELEHTKLTTAPGVRVKAHRVLESPVNMECILHQIIPLGDNSLVIGEVKVFHLEDRVYTGRDLDAHKLTIIGRMGGSFFLRATEIFAKTDEWDLAADLAVEKE
ncbi:MAG: flavin reductase family protein [Bacillota bacterium]|nr:flavin reductase family protein [Bacillota bacterium]